MNGKDEIRKIVRERYSKIPAKHSNCCGTSGSCCGKEGYRQISRNLGYSPEDLNGIPVAYAHLKKGDIVLDLGSGAGIDCFIAAKKVGIRGKVIGVDMTPEMVEKARENARKGNYRNVEFRLGEIENLPVADNTVDVIISNCVINLSPDKKRVFGEAFRVLKPGGSIMVSDLVLLRPLPKWARMSASLYVGCVAGAILKKDYIASIKSAGFSGVRIVKEDVYPLDTESGDPLLRQIAKEHGICESQVKRVADSVTSIKIGAMKPEKRERSSGNKI